MDDAHCLSRRHLERQQPQTSWSGAASFVGYRGNCATDCFGEKNPNAKLTAADVRDIRAQRAAGSRCRQVALQYGITPKYVSTIANRQVWRHIP